MSRTQTSQSVPMPRAERAPVSTISHLMSILRLWLWRRRCRRELSALTPEQMQDAGLNPEMVTRESSKPFWKV